MGRGMRPSMNKEFQTHYLNESGKRKGERITNLFDQLLVVLTTDPNDDLDQQHADRQMILCPPSRETAIMRTKLEEACFFARKSMCSQVQNTAEEKTPTPPAVAPPV